MESKLKLIYSCLVAIFIAFLSTSFSGDPPNARTGAPGDQLCSICHSGGSQTGSISIDGLTDDPLVPDKTYNLSIVIELTSGTSTRAGFQMVVLDGNDSGSPSTGTFSNFGTNVVASTTGSRVYLEHSGENNYVGNTVTYTTDWTAPSVAPNQISFYAAGNIANLGGAGGDLVVTTSLQDRALPVNLLDFNARSLENKVLLEWTTTKEINSSIFEVLRSINTKDYEVIGTLEAAGQSDEMINYEFFDHSPPTNRQVYYKLRQLDFDGNYFYSEIISTVVYSDTNEDLKIYANPVTAGMCLFVEVIMEYERSDISYEVYNQVGQLVSHNNSSIFGGTLSEGFNRLVLDTEGLSEGRYVFTLSQNGRIIKSGPFIVMDP